jgi:hypothetical protein
MTRRALTNFELQHSGEANRLREEAKQELAKANTYYDRANKLQRQNNELQDTNSRLVAQLDAERNAHLQQIAENTKREMTPAERKANIVRKYLRKTAFVSVEQGTWAQTPEIVEVNEDNIVSLFTPYGPNASRASLAQVQCDDLEITELPYGNCPVRLKILRQYGSNVQLGEIKRWEDRDQPAATPTFPKGDVVAYARLIKQDSPETRSLHLYKSSDNANSFLLETSTGETFIRDNVGISKLYMMKYVEFRAEGFIHSTSNFSGAFAHHLYVW